MSVPLCIDLDGTLIKTDSLFESFLILLKRNPFYLFIAITWLVKGIAYFKQEISKRVTLDPSILPYTNKLLGYLKEEYAKGREIILVTAADKKIAESIANYLGIFSGVLASDGRINLKGDNKRKLLNELYGEKQYDYAGNTKDDLKVWPSARHAIIVNASSGLFKQAQKISNSGKFFPYEHSKFRSFMKAIRVHQYVKNILIFIPLLASHTYFHLSSIINSLIAFIVFCLLASSVYLINDLLDLEADRQHRTKYKRPFAAGDFPISIGIIMILFFMITSIFLSLTLNKYFLLILISYFITTTIYSISLKKKLLLDVFVLAILYTMRIMAGIAALKTDYSEWLLTFSLFFFLSLAFVKRYSELYLTNKENKLNIIGRGYHVNDLVQLSLFGTVSGYMSTLIFALYISSNKVVALYHHPQWLWLVCLILLYWVSRIWMLATRGLIHEDPITFALEDRVSLFAAVAIVFIMFMASL